MKKAQWILLVTGWTIFFLLIPQVAFGNTIIEGTDRVLVETTNAKGEIVVESVLWDEVHVDATTYEEGEMVVASGGQNVLILEPDYIRSIHIVEQSGPLSPWSMNRIGAVHMKKQLLDVKQELTVAVIDSGIDGTHPYLKGRIKEGYNVLTDSKETMDVQSHGTHIAGIITDSTTPNIKIMPIAAIGKNGKGYDSDIAKGIRVAVDKGAKVINLSVGGKKFSQYLSDAIDYAISKNVLVVVSSGNEGDNIAKYYPASDKRVITVTATNHQDDVASFSNTGATVDIAAPGVGIYSTIPGGKYGRMNGTSMATPYVTAVAAMLMNANPTYSIQDIESLLKMHVEDLGKPGWDSLYGEGLLNVSQLEKPRATQEVIQFPTKQNVPLNKAWTITFEKPFMNTVPIEAMLSDGNSKIPIDIKKSGPEKKVTISPLKNYSKNKQYHLQIKVNQTVYKLDFTTTAQ